MSGVRLLGPLLLAALALGLVGCSESHLPPPRAAQACSDPSGALPVHYVYLDFEDGRYCVRMDFLGDGEGLSALPDIEVTGPYSLQQILRRTGSCDAHPPRYVDGSSTQVSA